MDDVQKLVEENPHLEMIKDDSGKERVKCKLTGHQLPCRLSDIVTYTKGKKYLRLLKALTVKEQPKDDTGNEQTKDLAFEKYKQYLVPAEKRRNQLYCKVTNKFINDIPHHIEVHVKGKRFQRALKTYQENDNSKEDEQDELNVWQPSDSESASEPDIDPLPDSFGEEDDDEEEEEEDDDKNDVEEEKDINKEKHREKPNSNKTHTQSRNKAQDTKNKDVTTKPRNTRKRKSKEEVSEQEEIPKKTKKQSNSTSHKNIRKKQKGRVN